MSAPFRVLLVNSISPFVEVESRYPPLGLGYLAAMARKRIGSERLEIRIVDSMTAEMVDQFHPQLVGVSSVSQNCGIALGHIAIAMERGIPTVYGGIHVTEVPECLPQGVVGCLGEGERVFTDLVQLAMAGGWGPSSWERIPGIAFRRDGHLWQSEEKPEVQNLDEIPFPARDLLSIKSHTYMFSSRGCPFHCSFCASTRFWDKLRFFSAEYVAAEIEQLIRNHGVELISFFDDNFPSDLRRIERLIQCLDRKGLLGRIRFSCSCRASILTKEIALLLKRLGVVSVGIGFESGSDRILRQLKGPSASVVKNHQAIRCLKSAGIAVNGSFVIGSPEEEIRDIQKTSRFIRSSGMDLAEVYLLTPLPGTPMWEHAAERGLVTTSGFDWSRIDVNAYRHPDGWIHLATKIPRESLWSWYQAIRRQCLRHNLRVIWKHPFRGDFLKVVKGMGKQLLIDLGLGSNDQGRGESLGAGVPLRGLSRGVRWFVAKVNSWLRFFK